MQITWVPMLANGISTVIHIFWCYLFVHIWKMDIVGLAIAMNISTFTMLLIITVNSYFIGSIKDALSLPSADSFKGWGQYLSLSIPATLMYCAEFWAFEIITILAGILGVEYQAANTIIFHTNT